MNRGIALLAIALLGCAATPPQADPPPQQVPASDLLMMQVQVWRDCLRTSWAMAGRMGSGNSANDPDARCSSFERQVREAWRQLPAGDRRTESVDAFVQRSRAGFDAELREIYQRNNYE